MSINLSREEWDFSSISLEHIDNAFFYEFSRQSPKIRNKVNEYRKLTPILSKIPSKYGSVIFEESEWKEHDKSDGKELDEADRIELVKEDGNKFVKSYWKKLNEKDKALLRAHAKNFKNNFFIEIIYHLSNCHSFPNVPFSKSHESERGDIPLNLQGMLDLGSRQKNGTGHEVVEIEGKTFWEIGDIPGMLHDYSSMHLLLVDWRKTDIELAQDFKEWVKRIRGLSEVTSTPAYARGLYNTPIPMPNNCKKKDKALEYLGVLRKRNACKTWNEYMHAYLDKNADQRGEEKKVAAANQLLNWFESQL